MERFVSSRGVDTAAVVGFEADALPQGPVDAGNPYAVENRMKAAERRIHRLRKMREVSALAMAENEMAVEESETGAAAENAAKDLQASEGDREIPAGNRQCRFGGTEEREICGGIYALRL